MCVFLGFEFSLCWDFFLLQLHLWDFPRLQHVIAQPWVCFNYACVVGVLCCDIDRFPGHFTEFSAKYSRSTIPFIAPRVDLQGRRIPIKKQKRKLDLESVEHCSEKSNYAVRSLEYMSPCPLTRLIILHISHA